MAAPLLIQEVHNFTGGNPKFKVYIMTGTTIEQLGNDITDTFVHSYSHNRASNLVINAAGGVYCGGKTGIFKLQTGTQFGDWSNTPANGGYTFAAPGGANTAALGPIFTSISDVPYIFGVYASNTSITRVWRINLLTGVGTEGSNQSVLPQNRGILYDGAYYSTSLTNDSNIYVINPTTLTITTIAQPTTGANSWYGLQAGYNIFNGKLYGINQNSPSGGAQGKPVVFEYGGGLFANIIELETTNQDEDVVANSRYALFDDGTNMYALYYWIANGGWKLKQLNPSGDTFVAGSDLTSILPAAVRTGASANSAFAVYKQLQTDGSNRTYLLYASNTPTGNYTVYEFINSNNISFVATGADSRYAIPDWQAGGGSSELDVTATQILVYKRERVTGGEKVTYRVYPPVDPLPGYDETGHTVKFYTGGADRVQTAQALLTGTATGGTSVRVGNEVQEVTADGTTDYTITIQASGFGDLDQITLVANVE